MAKMVMQNGHFLTKSDAFFFKYVVFSLEQEYHILIEPQVLRHRQFDERRQQKSYSGFNKHER